MDYIDIFFYNNSYLQNNNHMDNLIFTAHHTYSLSYAVSKSISASHWNQLMSKQQKL